MMEKKKTIQMRLSREELLYDIKNNAYIQADLMKTDDEHDKHQVFDIAEDGNIDRVSRMMDLAFRECEGFLYPYTKRPLADGSKCDDTLDSPDTYTFDMLVPEGFSHATHELLTDLIHEYIVCRVLEDWMSITYTKVASIWRAKAEEAKGKIEAHKNFRIGRTRRTQSPF